MADAPPFAPLSDLLGGWAEDVLHGAPPVLWAAGDGPLARFPLGPGSVCTIGGPPSVGKTVLGDQIVFDAVRLNPHLRALVTCCEMPARVLLDRQLSRLSGVPYKAIRGRALAAADEAAVKTGLATLAGVADRVGFLTGPFALDAVAAAADGIGADLILIDYLQRLDAPGKYRDKRSQMNAVLDQFRQFAAAGRGLLLLSAVGRQPSGKHGKSGYEGLSLASFKETGECEYSVDDAYILAPPDASGFSELHHLKARHAEKESITFRAELEYMRFAPAPSAPPDGAGGPLLDQARRAWPGRGPAKGGDG